MRWVFKPHYAIKPLLDRFAILCNEFARASMVTDLIDSLCRLLTLSNCIWKTRIVFYQISNYIQSSLSKIVCEQWYRVNRDWFFIHIYLLPDVRLQSTSSSTFCDTICAPKIIKFSLWFAICILHRISFDECNKIMNVKIFAGFLARSFLPRLTQSSTNVTE